MSGTYCIDDYTVKIKLLVDKDGELKTSQKVYKEFLTSGRTRFQTFITDFDIIGNDKILHFENLLGQICEVTFKISREVNAIKIPIFEDDKKYTTNTII